MGFLYTFLVFLSFCCPLGASIQKSANIKRPYLSTPALLETPLAEDSIEADKPSSEEEGRAPLGVFFTASYTYWCASEGGLDLGRSGVVLNGDDVFFHAQNRILSQPFQYQSGFKVGAGWKEGSFTLKGTYTWVSNSTSQTSLAPINSSIPDTGVWAVAPWFLQTPANGVSLSGTALGSQWRLRMDIADLVASCLLPQNKYLTVHAYGGVRALWIRQKMDITLEETPDIATPFVSTTIQSTTGSQCWSIGPRLGAETDILLGKRFRIESNLALSLLYTQYGKVFHREDQATDIFPASSVSASIHNQQALRPSLECSLGVGWRREIISSGYRLDLSATYDFMLFWNQNMMREMLGSFWNGTPANGDLYLHGLTVSGSFGF